MSEQEKPETPVEAPPAVKSTKLKRSASKKSKKPKRKRMSKKELARIKREKLEQERLEKLRREEELKDQREREYEQKKREEQQQRLLEEDSALKQHRAQMEEQGKAFRMAKASTLDWNAFLKCDHFVDARIEADVNAFISVWEEEKEADIEQLFAKYQQAEIIIEQLNTLLNDGILFREYREANRCRYQIKKIRDLFGQKLEAITAHYLAFSDRFAGAKNEVLISHSLGELAFGLWVNLSKNPRNKAIEFNQVIIEIPKAVAMYSLAIRTVLNPERPTCSNYVFVGRLFTCEFLQLPPPPKKITSIVLRQNPNKATVHVLSYPIRNVTAMQPPLNFNIPLDKNIPNAQVVQLVDGVPSTAHITKATIEDDRVLFSAICTGVFGLVVPKYQHFPFQFWELTAMSETRVEIYIRTAMLELAIYVDEEGKCSMDAPISVSKVSPVVLLEMLLDEGICLSAPKSTAALKDAKVTEKTAELETVLTNGIAESATGFVLSWSKWNAGLPGDRATLIVREQAEFPKDEFDDAYDREQERTRGHCILIKANHIQEVRYTEDMEEFDSQIKEETQIHQHLHPMIMDCASAPIVERVHNSPPLLCDALLYLLSEFRLFSITS